MIRLIRVRHLFDRQNSKVPNGWWPIRQLPSSNVRLTVIQYLYANRGVELAPKLHGFDGPTTRFRMLVLAHDLAPARSVFAPERDAVRDPGGG